MPILWTEVARVPELSKFLREGFCSGTGYRDFTEPDVLRWKFFDQRGVWAVPRSLVLCEEDRIDAHIGLCPTEFCDTRPGSSPISTIHATDWLSNRRVGGLGGLLLRKTFEHSRVQHVLGPTEAAARVLEGMRFKIAAKVPIYHKVLARTRPAAWREIHGRQPLWRKAILMSVDLLQGLPRPARSRNRRIRFEASPVAEFDHEVRRIVERCRLSVVFTSRAPEVLNHYLRHPRGTITGWQLRHDDHLCGFALISVLNKPHLRVGRIVECFLDSDDVTLWQRAVFCLECRMREMGCEIVSCFGSTPWMKEALLRNGFFRRGRALFYLRDPKGLLATVGPFHLTHLEADLAYV